MAANKEFLDITCERIFLLRSGSDVYYLWVQFIYIITGYYSIQSSINKRPLPTANNQPTTRSTRHIYQKLLLNNNTDSSFEILTKVQTELCHLTQFESYISSQLHYISHKQHQTQVLTTPNNQLYRVFLNGSLGFTCLYYIILQNQLISRQVAVQSEKLSNFRR